MPTDLSKTEVLCSRAVDTTATLLRVGELLRDASRSGKKRLPAIDDLAAVRMASFVSREGRTGRSLLVAAQGIAGPAHAAHLATWTLMALGLRRRARGDYSRQFGVTWRFQSLAALHVLGVLEEPAMRAAGFPAIVDRDPPASMRVLWDRVAPLEAHHDAWERRERQTDAERLCSWWRAAVPPDWSCASAVRQLDRVARHAGDDLFSVLVRCRRPGMIPMEARPWEDGRDVVAELLAHGRAPRLRLVDGRLTASARDVKDALDHAPILDDHATPAVRLDASIARGSTMTLGDTVAAPMPRDVRGASSVQSLRLLGLLGRLKPRDRRVVEATLALPEFPEKCGDTGHFKALVEAGAWTKTRQGLLRAWGRIEAAVG